MLRLFSGHTWEHASEGTHLLSIDRGLLLQVSSSPLCDEAQQLHFNTSHDKTERHILIASRSLVSVSSLIGDTLA